MKTRSGSIEPAGRGSSPVGPFRLYQRLKGTPPDAEQIGRMVEVGQVLDVGQDDAAWGFVVVQEVYLESVRETTERATRAVKAWCLGVLAAVSVLMGMAGLAIYSNSQQDAGAFREVAEAVHRLAGKVDERTSCVAAYGAAYCNALFEVNVSPDKRKFLIAIAGLEPNVAAWFANLTSIKELLDRLVAVTPTQWVEFNRILTMEPQKLKGLKQP